MTQLTRRTWLLGAAGASVVFAGRSAFARDTDGPKLVVIIARGAMDGLSVIVPHADRDYAPLRKAIAIAAPGQANGALPLDGDFGLHPAMTDLHAMHQAGEARFAAAAAIPVRLRSHFDAQDVLETGTGELFGRNDGWLNRALKATGAPGLAVGSQTPLILRGPVQAASWAPGGRATDDERLTTAIAQLYGRDPLLASAFASGLETESQARAATEGLRVGRAENAALGQAVGRLMKAADGPDIVALSLSGYDTHARQGAAEGALANRLAAQDAIIAALKSELGAVWSRTVVVVATEFGRTAAVNGTLGTDHGTASSMLLAGGALKRGGLIGDWPGLAQNRLFEGRDLAPTLDVRSVFKGVLRDHLGIDRAILDRDVFPNSAEARAVDGLV